MAPFVIDRRALVAGAASLAAMPALARKPIAAPKPRAFPKGFLWGAGVAGHQVEGNNVNADVWLLEQVRPSLFATPSGDACDSFARWPADLDLARGMGLNAYRFSLEWARIEPEEGQFSRAMLDHYLAMIEGCRARGLTPMVTFNHVTCPRWFAERGGWIDAGAPALFARYCERAARHLGAQIGWATTLNAPNQTNMLKLIAPPQVWAAQRAMLAAAARACGTMKFASAIAMDPDDVFAATRNLIAAHKAGRAAIKEVRPDTPVGVSLAMFDDQAGAKASARDAMRAMLYGSWTEAVHGDDFLGLQNDERVIWGENGRLPAPKGAVVNWTGAEVYAPSLAGAVRYAHQATGLPIMVTEHGVGTDNDRIRATFIPAALRELGAAMADGVPVLGYVHRSLIDGFEGPFGYKPKFGLHSCDPATFVRRAKPSAAVLAAIARANAV